MSVKVYAQSCVVVAAFHRSKSKERSDNPEQSTEKKKIKEEKEEEKVEDVSY